MQAKTFILGSFRREETLSISQTANLNNWDDSAAVKHGTQDTFIKTTHSNLPVPVKPTSSAEIDRPSNGSSTLQRAWIQLSTDVQVTHLKQKGKD